MPSALRESVLTEQHLYSKLFKENSGILRWPSLVYCRSLAAHTCKRAPARLQLLHFPLRVPLPLQQFLHIVVILALGHSVTIKEASFYYSRPSPYGQCPCP